jgi:uncharacterized protein with HEPN domain
VSYRDRQRLADIQAAIEAIRSHLRRGTLADGLVFDPVRIRLLEIGEAVKALPVDLLDTQPGIPWRQIAGVRDHLAHRYFDTAHAILQATLMTTCPSLNAPSSPWLSPCPTILTDPDSPGALAGFPRRFGRAWHLVHQGVYLPCRQPCRQDALPGPPDPLHPREHWHQVAL